MIPKNAKKVFSGIVYDIYQREQDLFDGTKAIFEIAKRTGTALVIPILDNGNILIGKQEQPTKHTFIDFFGGRQEKEESLLDTAKREFLEETGYKASNRELIISKNLGGSKLDWQIEYYLAKGLEKVGEPNLDSGEKIEILEFSLEDFLNLHLNTKIKLDKDFEETVKYISKNKEILKKLKRF